MLDKKTFDAFLERGKVIKEELKSISQVIEELRKLCEHDWHEGVSGHNDTMHTCKICSKIEFF